MKGFVVVVLLCALPAMAMAQYWTVWPGTISTVAGSGADGYTGDGGPAANATFRGPRGIAVDQSGNLYVADSENNAVRKISAGSRTVTTLAGTGYPGYSGDGGQASAAILCGPSAIAVDPQGSVYIADGGNNVVRRIDPNGLITTVAGTYQTPVAAATPVANIGDGGPATSATLSNPSGIALDATGALYIADTNNNRIRRVDPGTQTITTIAGSAAVGYAGDGEAATAAALNGPTGLALDGTGNIFIADTGNNLIRRVDAATQQISTIAGHAISAGQDTIGDGGTAANATLAAPQSVQVDGAGAIYVADTFDDVVRRIDPKSGLISVVAGFDPVNWNVLKLLEAANLPTGIVNDTSALTADVSLPYGIAADGSGNLFIADTGNHMVREVSFGNGAMSFLRQGTQVLTIANTDSTTEHFSAAVISGANAGDFAVGANTCASVAPGATCSVAISFTGSGGGTSLATLNVPEATRGSAAIALGGIANPTAVLTVSPSSLDFGTQTAGTPSAAQTITVANTGTAASKISGIAITGAQAGAFTIASNGCGASLTPGATCQLTVVFVASTDGLAQASVAVSDGTLSAAVSASLSGAGVGASAVSVAPGNLDFGTQNIGLVSAAQFVTVKNGGVGSATLSTPVVGGPDAPTFLIASNGCGSTLVSGGSCQIAIAFAPMTFGRRSASLSIAQPNGTVYFAVPLTGNGGGPQLTWSPSAIAFGEQSIGGTSQQTITVTNNGVSAATFSSVSISALGAPGQFAVASDGCGQSLAAGASCQLAIAFTPTIIGSPMAILTVNDLANSHVYSLQIGGTATVRGYGCCRVLRAPGVEGTAVVAAIATGSTVPVSQIATGVVSGAQPQPRDLFAGAMPMPATPQQPADASTDAASEPTQARMEPDPPPDYMPVATVVEPESPKAPVEVRTVLTATPTQMQVVEASGSETGSVLTIRNAGATAAVITGVSIEGNTSKEFAIASTNCSGRMFSNASCHVKLTYSPKAGEKHEGAAVLVTGTGFAESLRIPLNGAPTADHIGNLLMIGNQPHAQSPRQQ